MNSYAHSRGDEKKNECGCGECGVSSGGGGDSGIKSKYFLLFPYTNSSIYLPFTAILFLNI